MFNTALKKIADNGGKIDAATGEASAVVEKASKPTTPRKNKAAGDAEDDDEVKEKKSTPRKRKAAADGEEGEEKKSTPRKRKPAADGENGEEKKTPKKRMTKKQKEELAKKEQLDAEAAAAIARESSMLHWKWGSLMECDTDMWAATGADEGDEGLADAEVSENDKKILTEEAAHDDA